MQPFWTVWTAQTPSLVYWPLLLPDLSTFAGLGMVLMLSLTLRIAGIEGSTGMVMEVDEEVKWTGIASATAGLCGGVIGSPSPGLTTFNQEAGSRCVRGALLTGFLELGLWLSGIPAMNFFPRFLLAGILMNLGLVMLLEWMWNARRKVGRLGLLVIYAQVISAAVYGLLPSVLIGVAAACATAQAQLMTLHVLKFHVSGASISSYVRRSDADRAKLSMHKDQIECIGLEGILAEGPMLKFANYVRRYIKKNSAVKFMIFDFRCVQGTNATACALLSKLDRTLEDGDIFTLYTNCEAPTVQMLLSFGVAQSKIYDYDSACSSSFQLALRECEDRLLASAAEPLLYQKGMSPVGIDEDAMSPTSLSGEALRLAKLARYLRCRQDQAEALAKKGTFERRAPGTVLVLQGTRSSMLHIGVPEDSEVVEMVDVGQSYGAPHQVSAEGFGVLCGAECVLFDEHARATWSVSPAPCSEGSMLLSVGRAEVRALAVEDPELYMCLVTLAAKQLLRRGDALSQAVELNKGGGWRGAAFDRHTAEVCVSLLEDEGSGLQRLASPTQERKNVSRGGKNAVPSVPAPAPKRLARRDSITDWATGWLSQRETPMSTSPSQAFDRKMSFSVL